MSIVLNGPVTLTLKPETVGVILDVLAKTLPYNVGKTILEGEIFPQLETKEKKDVGLEHGADHSGERRSGGGGRSDKQE